MRPTRTFSTGQRMHRILSSAGIAILLAITLPSPSIAQSELARESIQQQLFPPDLIIREASLLQLTDAQRDALMSLVKETKKAMGEIRAKTEEATAKLGSALSESTVKESAALEQLNAVLEIEKEMKQRQFSMLIRAKNLLTPEQQEKLRQVPRKTLKGTDIRPMVDVREELDARMRKVQAGAERWRKEGRDPAPILDLIRVFGEQMQANKLSEAKDTLNRAIERLNEPKKP